MHVLLTWMFFDKMSPPQAEDGRPISTATAQKRPRSPRFIGNIFGDAVVIMRKIHLGRQKNTC